MSAAPILQFDRVTKTFQHRPSLFNWLGRERSGQTVALRSVTFSARAGEVLVLLGPNGSGKSTLLKLISTILLPDAGQVLVDGADTVKHGPRVRRQVGFAVATERSFFPRLTARENLDFFGALEDVPAPARTRRISDALRRVGLEHAGDTLVMKFSSGMYQRLGIARALLKQPGLLLLDEPTRSLDPRAVIDFWELIRRVAAEGSTILFATHSFEDAAALAHNVAVLRQGELVAHQPMTNWSAHELRDFYFSTVETQQPVEVAR